MRYSSAILGAVLLAALTPMHAAGAVASPSSAKPVPAVAAAPLTPAWTTYHNDNARSGNDTTEGTVTGVTPAWASPTLDGQVLASPLVYGTSAYVATENNTLYALSTANGTVQWSTHTLTPTDSTTLPCGNISPSVGVTGTPVIDPAGDAGNGVLFMVGMTSEPHYRLWGIDLVTHAIVFNSIVDPATISIQGQRGALAISGGNVYIPYGGRWGDCYAGSTPYYGIVIGVPENGAAHFAWNPASTEASGIWAPGGEAIDGSGNVYVATGNGVGPGSESVFKLSPTLAVLNQWRASNHQYLDDHDIDVGSISPGLVGAGDVFQNGKFGQGFLLSSSLAQLTADPGLTSCGGLNSDASFGATAYAAPYIYVPCSNGLYVYTQSGSTLSLAWNQLSGSFTGPPIVAGGDVWAMANGNLYGFNATTGTQIANVTVGVPDSHFQSPATGGGLIFVPGASSLQAFNLVQGCTTAGLTASPPTSQVVGQPVTFTATSSGPNCATPSYAYWLQYPNGTWVLQRTFTTDPNWTWTTTGFPAGNYNVHVWANETPANTWEAYASLSYTLTGQAHCATASLAPANPTQAAGTTVNFVGSSTGCSSPQYEFWIQYPNGTWYLKRGFGVNTFNWSTAGLAPGTYTAHVWANQAGDPTGTWEAYGSSTVTLTGCATAALSPSPTSAPAGTTAVITATSTGCTSPRYEFWVQYPNGTWYLIQGWGAGTFNWNTTGLAPGSYLVHAWANNTGDPTATWESYGSDTVTLTGCATASLSPSSGSSAVGAKVTFTATSTGCPTPIYAFWLQYPGGSWYLLQKFTPGLTTWQWNTAGYPKGNYVVHVWANNQGSSYSTYETYGTATYTLT